MGKASTKKKGGGAKKGGTSVIFISAQLSEKYTPP